MAYLFEFQDDRILVVVYQRTILNDGWFWGYVWFVARVENPTEILVEVACKLHSIEVVHLLAGDGLILKAYSLSIPLIAVGEQFGSELAVIIYTLKNIILIGTLIEFS